MSAVCTIQHVRNTNLKFILNVCVNGMNYFVICRNMKWMLVLSLACSHDDCTQINDIN